MHIDRLAHPVLTVYVHNPDQNLIEITNDIN
jgi:hypothetical protein